MERIASLISKWLREQVEGAGARGLVVGLSGGIDSACTAALAQRAVGENVLGVLMPCHSSPADADYARQVADALNLKTATVDLGPAYDTLVEGLPPADRLVSANIKPRLRMAVLYYMAAANSYLVAGTGNKSELMVGYYTKYGDGGVDLEPLGDLYKTQVRELAHELGVPQAVIDRPPTAGLWPDQTDESEMGLSYTVLDATLAAIETGRTDDLDPAVVEQVRAMMRASEHKRHVPPVCQVQP